MLAIIIVLLIAILVIMVTNKGNCPAKCPTSSSAEAATTPIGRCLYSCDIQHDLCYKKCDPNDDICIRNCYQLKSDCYTSCLNYK